VDLTRNIGSNERTIRVVAGAVLLAWSMAGLGFLSSFFGFLMAVIGIVLMATSIISFCPLYKKLGMDSFR